MPSVHQFVAGFTNGDAISNEARVIRDLFRRWGYESDIFCEPRRILPQLRAEAKDAQLYAATADESDTVLLHLSIGSPVNDVFKTLRCRKAILYHNVTPPEYLHLVNKRTAYSLEQGRDQARSLRDTASVVMADSHFNARELKEMGYNDVRVLPLVLDLDKLTAQPDRRTVRRFRDDRVNVLFVGRCAPNKKIDDVIRAFYCFQKYVEPRSRLIHVGSFDGVESYYYLLKTLVRDLGLDAVHFAGSVPQAQLNAFYASADAFLCMSEHEGFCIPLIEAMVHDVPIVAYSAAAVPETLDGAGILFHEKQFEAVAEMMGQVVRDGKLRRGVLTGQRERLERWRSRDLEQELKGHMAPLLGERSEHG